MYTMFSICSINPAKVENDMTVQSVTISKVDPYFAHRF